MYGPSDETPPVAPGARNSLISGAVFEHRSGGARRVDGVELRRCTPRACHRRGSATATGHRWAAESVVPAAPARGATAGTAGALAAARLPPPRARARWPAPACYGAP